MSPSMKIEVSPNLKESISRVAAKADAYLGGLVNFIKWTTALSLAAAAWIANSVPSSEGISHCLMIASLACLSASVVVAIFTVKRALDSWGKQWLIAKASYSLTEIEEIWARILQDEFLEKRRDEASELLSARLDSANKLDHPTCFNRMALAHMILSATAILLYIVGLLI